MGAVAHGRAFTTIGTSGSIYAHSAEYHADPMGRFHTYCSAVDGEWAYLGAIQTAGLTLRWFCENFCGTLDADAAALGLDSYALLDREADGISPGSDGLFFLPYLLGERTPHLDPHARGCFIGLRPTHGRAAMGRAVIEGVTFALADCLVLFDTLGVRVDNMAACGGGGRSPFWRQMLADVFGCPIAEPAVREGAALGAALLGGVGVGLYPSIPAACDAACAIVSRAEPMRTEAYAPIYALWRELYPVLKESFAKIDILNGR
jgi:xylulokinase